MSPTPSTISDLRLKIAVLVTLQWGLFEFLKRFIDAYESPVESFRQDHELGSLVQGRPSQTLHDDRHRTVGKVIGIFFKDGPIVKGRSLPWVLLHRWVPRAYWDLDDSNQVEIRNGDSSSTNSCAEPTRRRIQSIST